MAWTVGSGYDTSNVMALMRSADCSSKEALVAMFGSCQQLPPLRGFENPKPRIVPKRPFWSFLDDQDDAGEDDVTDDSPQHKKKRLTAEQVRSLEISFDMENKLEPERKQQLADKLGLQPRQVAVWFQNRRARWKTKQLEHDFGVLKSQYDAIVAEREILRAEVSRLTTELEATVKDTTGELLQAEREHALEVANDAQLQVQPLKADFSETLNQVSSPDSEKMMSSKNKETSSPAYSDYSDIMDAGSPHEGSTPPQLDAGSGRKSDESVVCKAEAVEFAYSPSQASNGIVDSYHMYQHLAMKIDDGFLSEEPYCSHIPMDWLWLN